MTSQWPCSPHNGKPKYERHHMIIRLIWSFLCVTQLLRQELPIQSLRRCKLLLASIRSRCQRFYCYVDGVPRVSGKSETCVGLLTTNPRLKLMRCNANYVSGAEKGREYNRRGIKILTICRRSCVLRCSYTRQKTSIFSSFWGVRRRARQLSTTLDELFWSVPGSSPNSSERGKYGGLLLSIRTPQNAWSPANGQNLYSLPFSAPECWWRIEIRSVSASCLHNRRCIINCYAAATVHPCNNQNDILAILHILLEYTNELWFATSWRMHYCRGSQFVDDSFICFSTLFHIFF